MIYIKLLDADENVVAVEEHENPVYLCAVNGGRIIRCEEHKAQGILSADCSVAYNLNGDVGGELTAVIITPGEYDVLSMSMSQVDIEDTEPEVPPETTEEEILTRAELTAKVAALEEQLLATKILLGVE